MSEYNFNQPEFYYNIGKGGVIEEGIFERFPELIPAVGEHYWREDNSHKKLFLVGESNYFNDIDIQNSDFLDAEKWYKEKSAKLIPENRKKEVCNWKGGYRTFENVYKVMNNVLSVAGIAYDDYLLQEAAFYNYFLRPAYNDGKHKGFIPQSIDREVSGIALSGVIDRLQPDLVIFLSKKAYDGFSQYIGRDARLYDKSFIEFVYHPGSPRWNRDNGAQGRAKFEELLKHFWVVKK